MLPAPRVPTSGNGHSYFQQSPWVSSDILMLLMHDLTPQQRGLVKGDAMWTFPPDYIERLQATLDGLTGGGLPG